MTADLILSRMRADQHEQRERVLHNLLVGKRDNDDRALARWADDGGQVR